MQFRYTHHARQRMKQRRVTEQQVEETLLFPDRIEPGENGGDIAVRRYVGREVHVVFSEPEEDVFIIYTVMKPRIRNR